MSERKFSSEAINLKPLTFENQLNTFNFIHNFRQKYDFGPTIRDIGEAIGVDSTSVVKYAIKTLKESGYIDYALNKNGQMRAGSIKCTAEPNQIILAPNFKRSSTSEE